VIDMKAHLWLAAALVLAPLVPHALAARTALPGTINYIEGQVTVDGKPMAASQDGSMALGPNDILSVGTGKAEILLSPGTFLRVGNGGQVRMVAPELANPRVQVMHGEAMVEVDYKPKPPRRHGARRRHAIA
jgi:hypothetical protein